MNNLSINTTSFERELLEFLQRKKCAIIQYARKHNIFPREVQIPHTDLMEKRADSATVSVLVSDLLAGSEMPVGDIIDQHAVCMFVDMVGSTRRKQQYPIDNSELSRRKKNKFIHYATNQLYIDTMIWIVRHSDHRGTLAGIRGDGAFFAWVYDSQEAKIDATKRALVCANIIRQVVLTFVNDVLHSLCVPKIGIRIGMDRGAIMITHVGYDDAKELSILGQVADQAAKNSDSSNCDENAINVPESFINDYPSSPSGKMSFIKSRNGYNIVYDCNAVGSLYEVNCVGGKVVPSFNPSLLLERVKAESNITRYLFGNN